MYFSDPYYFWVLLAVPAYVAWYVAGGHRRRPQLCWADTGALSHQPLTLRRALLHAPMVLRVLALSLLIVAMARPQTHFSLLERHRQGIDIMLSVDISASMNTPDLSGSRIDAARRVAQEFVSGREDDQIGLTLFAGEAFTQCPLTLDHRAVLEALRRADCSYQTRGILANGTAIGMGLANALAHLEHSQTRSKVVILMTDGVNNTGELSPQAAAQLAAKAGVRVYTILLGSGGAQRQAIAVLPDGSLYEADLEETTDNETLKQIAQTTHGRSYTAESMRSLRDIYADIDKLEKTRLHEARTTERNDAFQLFALSALLCLVLELLLRYTILRIRP